MSARTCIQKHAFLYTSRRKHIAVIEIPPLTQLEPARFDRPDILKALTAASRQLAELKGVAARCPIRKS